MKIANPYALGGVPMKRQNQYQWTLASRCVIPILMTHKDMKILIGHDTLGGVNSIYIYDFLDVEIHKDAVYEVRRQRDGSFAGEIRPITATVDQIVDTARDKATWMTPEDKVAMLNLMRKALSFRVAPLPKEFAAIWDQAHRIVSELDIINAGLPRQYGQQE